MPKPRRHELSDEEWGLLAQLQARLEREARLDWELWCIDGTSVRAHKAAAGAGKKPAPR